jgi:uncharacterized protein
MNLEYRGQERIPASKDVVWAFITHPVKVASCMPDLDSSKMIDARRFDAIVQVAVGPVRGKLTFHVTLDPQPERDRVAMTISGGGFGSVVDLRADSDVRDNGDGTTTLDWHATATLRGPLATIGSRVIDAQAKRVISTTFANIKNKLSTAAV